MGARSLPGARGVVPLGGLSRRGASRSGRLANTPLQRRSLASTFRTRQPWEAELSIEASGPAIGSRASGVHRTAVEISRALRQNRSNGDESPGWGRNDSMKLLRSAGLEKTRSNPGRSRSRGLLPDVEPCWRGSTSTLLPEGTHPFHQICSLEARQRREACSGPSRSDQISGTDCPEST